MLRYIKLSRNKSAFKSFTGLNVEEFNSLYNKVESRYNRIKRKRHTVKTQITVNKNGLIIHKSRHFVGRRHDYNIFKHSNPRLPQNVMRIMDLGYYGVEDDYPNLNFMLPYKRGKSGTLTDMQKKFNKMLSKMRIVVEHVICRMKKYRIFGLRYRNRLRHYDLMTDIVSGLINMKIIEINV